MVLQVRVFEWSVGIEIGFEAENDDVKGLVKSNESVRYRSVPATRDGQLVQTHGENEQL